MAPDDDISDDEDPDALAAEWEAMAGDDDLADDDDDDDAGSGGGDGEDISDDLDAGGSGERVLDQDEIDSLLGFGDDDAAGSDNSGVRAIINSALVSYERLPMLEVVFDRLVRMMTTTMRNFTSDNVEVSLDSITSIRFGDYLNSIPLPAMLTVFKADEWDNYGLMVVDSSLIYSIVDVLLGGRRGTAAMAIEGRPYTTIERRLVERMVNVVLRDMEAAFEPLSKVKFLFDRLETNPRFATIARPANAAVLARLRVDMEDRGGRMEMLLPYATLEPVRELLLQQFMGEKFGRDSIWETHLATELWHTDVNVMAVLDEQILSLSDVMNWEVGSHLNLNATPTSDVALRFGEITMFNGKMGRKGRSIAVKIEDRIQRTI